MTAWPRLMRATTARRYLDGLDPLLELGATPQFHKGEPYFDRAQLDRLVDGQGGIAPLMGDGPEADLQAFLERQARGSA